MAHYAEYRGVYYDVKDLIRVAATRPVTRVPVDEYDYVLDGGDYARRVKHGRAHQQRAASADLRYPIILGPDKSIFDGVHRLAKAKTLGRKTIKAVRLTRLPKGYTRQQMERRVNA